ncbi:efflux transporter outer membrane subunit [Sphingomonas melonis]|uniref:NodT family efflux transporter outer membrane factor (OMF) lipoprotein n=1 Tax=Sphingomonas melonis TaxID=152682 RepID=A0A7Y9FN28_9SPHN|nr:TolC family protein [Sphingomonas melonis]NYD89131.1 NodT family efflux transporter outer membrane factor (OMF) lipoprotein [Sphingomonas melonis]
MFSNALCKTAAAVLALTVAACAPSVHLPSAKTALPVAFEQSLLAEANVPLDQWWTVFDDAQLSGLIESALADGFDSRLAFARLLEARAVRSRSIRDTGPTGNLGATYTRPYTSQLSTNLPAIDFGTPSAGGTDLSQLFNPTGPINNYGLSLNASWEIDLFGRLAAVRRQARETFAAETLDYQATRVSVAADIASYLFQARGEAAQLANARDTLRISGELAAAARLGVERGLTAGGDAARIETDEANARAEVARFSNALDTSRRQILILTGRGTDPLASLVITPDLSPAPAPPATIPAQLLARRPDVRVAELRLAAAATQVRVDRLALFPRIDLRPGAAFSSTNAPLGATSIVWTLGAGLALPVLDRPRLLASLRITEARGLQAVVSYERAVQTAYQEADRALASIIADRERSAALDRAEERARFAFDAARTGYRIGVTDLTALLQAEQAWRTARTAAINQRSLSLRDTVAAYRSLGGGWTPVPDADAAGLVLTSTSHRTGTR